MPNSNADFSGLLLPGGVIPALPAFSRHAALQALARAAGEQLGQPWQSVHDRLPSGEALNDTAIGGGVAIPHVRLACLTGCAVIVARLPEPIDWQASDGEPVDVLVLLLSPEQAGADHLKALARISRRLREPATLPALRGAADAAEMLAALTPETVAG